MPRAEKVAAVEEIADRFKQVDAALLTEYRGLSVGDIAEVRGALRAADADYKVLKNTLARLAVTEVGFGELVDMLQGPTAIAFIRGDAVQAAKALDDAARKFPVLVFKGGVLQGRVIDAGQAQALARLEPLDVQLAKIVMMVNAPLQQTVNALAALLRDLGSMLAQVLAQKEEAGPGEEEAERAVDAPTEPDQAEVTDAPPQVPDEDTASQSEPADK